MTATANEDSGDIKICSNQIYLVESALRWGTELETEPRIEKDWMEREYVKICIITQEPNQNNQDFNKELLELFGRFFELFDECKNIESKTEDEMRGLYNALSIDDCGSDVYLSDGVWLSSDGSLHDRG